MAYELKAGLSEIDEMPFPPAKPTAAPRLSKLPRFTGAIADGFAIRGRMVRGSS